MKAFYELVVIGLRIWGVVFAIMFVASLSDLVFKGSAKHFAIRVFYALIWPLALASTSGRRILAGEFEEI